MAWLSKAFLAGAVVVVAVVVLLPMAYCARSSVEMQIPGEHTSSSVRVPDPLHWNAWTEDSIDPRPTGAAVDRVEPGRRVLLTVDLAAMAYGEGLSGGGPVASAFEDLLTQPGLPNQVDFEASLIPDGDYFDIERTGAIVEGQLPVDMLRLRSHLEAPQVLSDRYPEGVRVHDAVADGLAPFTFGRMSFLLDLKDDVSGLATASILIWHRNAVLDQVDVAVCVAKGTALPDDCSKGGAARVPQLARGLPEYERPLTIHFGQFRNRPKVFGVARAARSRRVVAWRLDDSLDQLRKSIDVQLASIRGESSELRLSDAGWRLYNTLFPIGADGSSPITSLLRDLAAPSTPFATDAPVISVRITDASGDPLLIPLGLMHDGNDFLGRRYRVEAPLGTDAVRLQPCPAGWVVVRPEHTTTDAAIVEATKRATAVFDGWALAGATHFDGPAGWRSKLAGPSHESSAVVILSHHDADRLIFPGPSGDEFLYPYDVVARFARPSLVLLNGCGTARPGASEFVRKLHSRGVDAVVATAAEVSAELAGDYIRCFAGALEASRTAAIRDLHWAALRCVEREGRAEGGIPHGANILKYVVLGNGAMSACAPTPAH